MHGVLGTYGLDGYGDTMFGDETCFFSYLLMIKPTECLYFFLVFWFHDISTGYVWQKRALDCLMIERLNEIRLGRNLKKGSLLFTI